MLTDFPLGDTFAPDWRVAGVTLGLATFAGVLAGLSPALETLRFGAADALRLPGRVAAGLVNRRLRGTLVANQLSISLALLIVIVTLARAQQRVLAAQLDYDAAATIVTGIDLERAGYDGRAGAAFYERLVPSLEAIRGVQRVALSGPPPFRGLNRRPVGVADDTRQTVLTYCRAVSPGFFAIAGIRLLNGRLFTDVEARIPRPLMPVVVSEAFARAYFPGVDSVGRRIRVGNEGRAEIVGVVADTISIRPAARDEPIVYQPLYTGTVANLSPIVQSDGAARHVPDAIRARVRALDSRLTATPETVAAIVARAGNQYAAMIRMTAVPGGLALLLSLIGIYGLTAFAAAQRKHEIAVRTALGATPREVLSLFLRSLRRAFLTGALAGCALAIAGLWLLRRTNLTLDLPSVDPLACFTALVVVLGAAVTATSIPALRASKNDPWAALKE
jgi:hypothetical protein